MQLSEMRYITGLIVQGGGKIVGYSLAEPTGEIKQPDYVMANNLKSYLTNNKCQIINAVVDASGQVSFRSKADQESYVTMNASGYILGWPKRPLNKLHEGNKTGGKTGEILRPTHSYLIVDINEAENVVKVMNIAGMVKPMTLTKLVSAINEGLIVSNVEIVNHRVKLLSKGMDELTIGKPKSTSASSIPPITMTTSTVQPAAQTSKSVAVPLKPPTFVPGKELQKPMMSPIITPPATEKLTIPSAVSKPVIPPVVPPTVHAKSAVPSIPTVQPKVIQPSVQPTTPATPKTSLVHELNLREIIDKQYNFNNYVTDYSDCAVKIRFDLEDLAPEQFELITVDGKNCLTYVTDGTGTHELPYFIRDYGPELRIFLQLFSSKKNREALVGTIVNLYYNGKPVHAFDYRMLYIEQGFLNFAYLIDWYNVDLFCLESETDLWQVQMNTQVSELLLPNKVLNVKDKTLRELDHLYGRFDAYYPDVWAGLLLYDDLRHDARAEDLTITTHPKSRITEMKDNGLRIFLDFPFGKNVEAKKIHIDLTKTGLRFLPKKAIQVQHGANYEIHVPTTCKRIHNDAVETEKLKNSKRRRLDRDEDDYAYNRHTNGKNCSNVTQANTVTIHGSQLERIDRLGIPYAISSETQVREFIRVNDWSNITNLTETTIAIEDLPEVKKEVNVAQFIDTDKDEILVNNWRGIGTWSDIGKGKLHLQLTSRPEASLNHTNLFIDSTATKVKIELISERESYGYSWPVIDYLYVEEGVTEVEIIARTLVYNEGKKNKTPGYHYNYIKHLILPPSCTNFVLKLTHRNHERFVREIDIPDNSVLSRLDLKTLFNNFAVKPDDVYRYANAKTMHDKNMLSDMIGSDLTHVQQVEFNNDSVKYNLSLCGINL